MDSVVTDHDVLEDAIVQAYLREAWKLSERNFFLQRSPMIITSTISYNGGETLGLKHKEHKSQGKREVKLHSEVSPLLAS